jgi:glycosyltransferase involved in cell wall biosynthesis
VNLEAMAAGKPVVATCFGGSREAIKDGVNGYIVNPFNVPVLAEKIVDLLQSPEKMQRFGLASRERVVTEFTLEKQAVAFEKIYTQK